MGITSDIMPTLITEKRFVIPNTNTNSAGLLKHCGDGGGLNSGRSQVSGQVKTLVG